MYLSWPTIQKYRNTGKTCWGSCFQFDDRKRLLDPGRWWQVGGTQRRLPRQNDRLQWNQTSCFGNTHSSKRSCCDSTQSRTGCHWSYHMPYTHHYAVIFEEPSEEETEGVVEYSEYSQDEEVEVAWVRSTRQEPEWHAGCPLLPLANGNFVEFRSLQYNREPSAAVYVPSLRHSRSLFYNMESRFLDDHVHSPALHYLSQVAADTNSPTKHPVQLVRINRTIAVNLVRQILPKEWSGLTIWFCGIRDKMGIHVNPVGERMEMDSKWLSEWSLSAWGPSFNSSLSLWEPHHREAKSIKPGY